MSGTTEVKETSAPAASQTEATPKKSSATKRLIAGAILLVAVIAGLIYWLHARHFETTDDAAIDGHFASLSTRIAGTVTYVNPDVENNHTVAAGTLLLALDPRDYEAELEHAKANLETKEAEANVARIGVPIADATAYSNLQLAQAAKQEAVEDVGSAQAELLTAQHRVQLDQAIASRAERDRVRYQTLVDKREISRSFFDARETEAASTMQTLEADQAAVTAAQQKIAQRRALVQERDAQIAGARTAPQRAADARAQSSSAKGELDQARADVHTAELNLSYTKVYAPVSGIVGHKTVELGHRVQPGQTLLTVVPTDDIWITANYKETQLRLMHPGQAVTIHVDTFDRDYNATIEDMAAASGPLFSLFPPENASGNYVKIVQRFPVRIRLDRDQDPAHQLRPGMSAEASVKVR
ncbi:HlyD family secretion protein [Granulicella sibirica]|uniref:Membrane fusion component of tripartite multidrug resistance system n=1 Tax=Granulicella sibirica TaxID=2479048 RepID=A0A4Q0T713_9BACT|nr:HlyD family secretion protein [Granulicella sibirica]RXH57829.1 Membrane fusion component of tripartite multidrug resistance system [Granulicella sibirica]